LQIRPCQRVGLHCTAYHPIVVAHTRIAIRIPQEPQHLTNGYRFSHPLPPSLVSELLNIAEAPARLEHEPRGIGDECAPPGMRRAAIELQISVQSGEPVDDAARPQRIATLRFDDRPIHFVVLLQSTQRTRQFRVYRDRATTTLFCRGIMQLDLRGDPALSIDDHRPGQLGDLASPKASFGREQNDGSITIAVSTPASLPQRRRKLLFYRNLSLLSGYLTQNTNIRCMSYYHRLQNQ